MLYIVSKKEEMKKCSRSNHRPFYGENFFYCMKAIFRFSRFFFISFIRVRHTRKKKSHARNDKLLRKRGGKKVLKKPLKDLFETE